MINILIVDDHTMFSDGVESILAKEADLHIAGKVHKGADIFDFLEKHTIDLILLDINLTDTTGIEVSKQLRKTHPSVKILIVSMFNQESYITESLKQGALGYILKDTGKKELLIAIRAVYNGKSYFCKAVQETIMQSLLTNQNSNKKSMHLPKLSRREKEVLELIAQEYTTKEIARQLFISLKTVESHRSSLLAKFEVRNSVGLVRLAVKNGLI